MTLLTPLGLLGLIGIGALILIYILRPNYQQKRVSSTYVWKLSLKYKKKRIPISKLRNILIILCQVLALIACAFMLTQPQKILSSKIDYSEAVIVVDASASMRTSTEDETRFERAVKGAIEEADAMLNKGCLVSIVVADSDPYFLCEKVGVENRFELDEKFDEILNEDSFCSYGTADINAAMALCKQITTYNPNAAITLFTDTQYRYVPEAVKVVNVSEEDEWNAAILDVRTVLEDNYYVFYVDVACYGRDAELEVEIEIEGGNANDIQSTGRQIILDASVSCSRDKTKTIVFKYYSEDQKAPVSSPDDDIVYCEVANDSKVYAYQSLNVFLKGLELQEADSFPQDNTFNVYGGQREILRIQYASTSGNKFFNAILDVLQNEYKRLNRWDIQIVEVQIDQGQVPATEGFDFYIFEHTVPDTMPVDGVVFLADPDRSPRNAEFSLGSEVRFDFDQYCMPDSTHTVMTKVRAEEITLTKYSRITTYGASYINLMSCNGSPVLLLKDDNTMQSGDAASALSSSKVVVMPFSVHYSNLVITNNFPQLMLNLMEYFFPATVGGNTFDVLENISVNARSLSVTVTNVADPTFDETVDIPGTIRIATPGTYVISQQTYFGKNVSESIYVRVPAAESNVCRIDDAFDNPYETKDETKYFEDLMFYIAIGLVALLFIEWILNIRERV